MSRIVPSLQDILKTHAVPGQYLHMFKTQKKSDLVSIVKTDQKKKKREIQKLNHLIPKIEAALETASQEPFLKNMLKGIRFPKIEADSQRLTLYYSFHQKFNLDQRKKNLDLSRGLLYKYLTGQILSKRFPSRLEFRQYSFREEQLDEIYSKIQAELGLK